MTFIARVEAALGDRLGTPTRRRLGWPVFTASLAGMERDGRGGDIWTAEVSVAGPIAQETNAMRVHEDYIAMALGLLDAETTIWVDSVSAPAIEGLDSAGSASALVSTITVRGQR